MPIRPIALALLLAAAQAQAATKQHARPVPPVEETPPADIDVSI